MPIKNPRDKVINTFGNTEFQISVVGLWRVIKIYTLVNIKDTNEKPDEEVHRTRSGKNPSTGAFVCWSWGAWHINIYSHGVYGQPWRRQTREELQGLQKQGEKEQEQ